MKTYTVPVNDTQTDAIGAHIAPGSWVKLYVEGAEHYEGVPDHLRLRLRSLGVTEYGTFAQVVSVDRDAMTMTVKPNPHRLTDDEPNTAADFDPELSLSADGKTGRLVDYTEFAA